MNLSTLTPPIELELSPVPTPSTFDEAVKYMGGDSQERIVGMWATLRYKNKAEEAMLLIIGNMYYVPSSDVRSNAARVLGELGPIAIRAVPDLIKVMQKDESLNVQIDAARSLGKIGDTRALPALAENLYKNNNDLAIYSAKSISLLSGETFTDSDSLGGYRLNEKGIPLIVIAARQWWENVGKYKNW
jgi:HEAT repeat protein